MSVCIVSDGVGSSGGGKPAGGEGGGVKAAAADQQGRPGLLCTDPSSGAPSELVSMTCVM